MENELNLKFKSDGLSSVRLSMLCFVCIVASLTDGVCVPTDVHIEFDSAPIELSSMESIILLNGSFSITNVNKQNHMLILVKRVLNEFESLLQCCYSKV